MKTMTLVAVWLAAVTGGLALAQPPRVCHVAPSQSAYTHYVAPTGNYSLQGYTQSGNHFRRRNVVRIIDVAQINPAYLSVYSPDGYDTATQAAILTEIKALTARLDQLNLALQKSQAPPPAAPPAGPPAVIVTPPATPGAPPVVTPIPVTPAPQPRPSGTAPGGSIGLAVFAAKCAACHQAGKLLPDQKFTLLDAKGALVTLTDAQKLRVIQKTYSAQMPPPNNVHGIPGLTDSEFAAVVELMR